MTISSAPRRASLPLVPLLWALFVSLPSPAWAQARPPAGAPQTHAIVGRVTDTLGAPLAGTQVTVDGQPRAITNEAGQFTVRGLAPASFFLVNVRRLGYGEVTAEILPGENGVAEVRFELVGGARQLEGMRTTADRVTPFDRFEAHRHARYGSFLDPVDLAERKPALPSDALVGVPMVRVTRRGDGVVVLGRRTGRGECEMSLLVNGVPRRLMQPGDFDLLVGPVEHVRAVEVYARASDVPAEYIYESDMLQCGLVAVWTSITARQSALPAPARASP